jgi:hypothetical protein
MLRCAQSLPGEFQAEAQPQEILDVGNRHPPGWQI